MYVCELSVSEQVIADSTEHAFGNIKIAVCSCSFEQDSACCSFWQRTVIFLKVIIVYALGSMAVFESLCDL